MAIKGSESQGQRHRNREAERMRANAAAVSCIGTIPAIVNPARREFSRRDLLKFLTVYFPESTGLSVFGEDQKRAVLRIQGCVFDGGRFGEAFPRGYAKTTILENSAVWALIYGHRKFIPIFGADANAADQNILSIKREFSENDLLMEDFPEVCHAVRALEGKAQRCGSQTHKPGDVEGNAVDAAPELTHISWTSDKLVLPTCMVPEGWGTVEGPKPGARLVAAAGAGGIVVARGLTAGSRGMKHKRTDGKNQRPDFVFLDDPQTDESAESPTQVSKRLNLIKKTILKLGGHDRPMAVVCAGTIIQPDDLMDQLLDPVRNPSWQGERISMVKTWGPAKETLWLEEYAKLRNTYDPTKPGDQTRAHEEANAFYRAHRREMDAGHELAWDQCYYDYIEISAIQHAYNLLIDDGEEVFDSECQNKPKPRVEVVSLAPKPAAIAAKANGIPRGVVPRGHHTLTVFVDVQKSCLPYVVASWEAGFGGHILDYALYPDQPRGYVGIADVKRTLQDIHGKELETCLLDGMAALVERLASREFMREDGTAMRVGRIGIDENWGMSTDFVHSFCRRSQFASLLIPQDGRSYPASSRGIDSYKVNRAAGEQGGYGWILTKIRNNRHVVCDVNMWKSFAHRRLALPANTPGGWTLFGKPEQHETFTQQLAAEYPDEQTSKNTGRTVTLWQKLPARENHALDLVVGAAVMASCMGVTVHGADAARGQRARKKYTAADFARAR